MKGMKRGVEFNEIDPTNFSKMQMHEFSSYIQKITKEFAITDVIDFGCGVDPFAASFSKKAYLGLDIDEEAIAKSSKIFQGYAFKKADESKYSTDMCIASKVFSYMNDGDLDKVLTKMRCKWLLMVENLSSDNEKENITSINGRDHQRYISMLRNHDLLLMKKSEQEDKAGNMHTFLLFKKCIKNPIS